MANFGSEQKAPERATASVTPPVISLPKGGGAIRGVGEKFSANPVTGSGTIQLPIATSPGRNGFGPRLALTYDSGAGNGPFGWGWRLDLPAITRKTEKGLPQYFDGDDESDVFILSGAEDLVPALRKTGTSWQVEEVARTVDGAPFQVRRYRPRIEGPFARIERWTNSDTGESHWRSISAADVTTLYGRSHESRIADPANPSRVFSWLACESRDDKGNAIVYSYAAENSAGIDLSLTHERNRTPDSRTANRYLKRIRYANVPSRLVHADLESMAWLFEVVLDYGEGHVESISPGSQDQEFVKAASNPLTPWTVRKDPFSTYRPAFEVRTYRLCRRVLMFHHFPGELGTPDCLVSSTELVHDESPIATFVTRAVQSGYVRQSDGSYLRKSLPPVEFDYSRAEINGDVVSIGRSSLEQLPAGLSEAPVRSLDLNGEGISGVLSEQTAGWYYKQNLSPLAAPGEDDAEGRARFAPAQLLTSQPSLAALARDQQFLDLAGDGQVDLVHFGRESGGYYERTADDDWSDFVPFASIPNVDVGDPNARLIDLTGDGHADLLIAEEGAFLWHASLAEAGFGEAQRVPQALDEENGPRLIFEDGTESIYLADLSGDGLTDLVRIRNGEVCYWPNLGYGRFGSKVTMDGAPWFDSPDQFEQRRIRLGDIDGSGTTDIVYLGRDAIAVWRNESGNGWSAPIRLTEFPGADALSAVSVFDLLGNGTACLVWSSQLPGETRPMQYIDLMGGQKPHLLVGVRNNLGAETRVHYVPSTSFYLADKAAGRPWITRLPFPVHVVDRVETYDRVGRNRFVTRYGYHHGYFDGDEREFRGFGMVEQWDTEELAALTAAGALSEATNIEEASHVPPVLTRTWFHTGAFIEGARISRQFANEYYREGDASQGIAGLTDVQMSALLLDDTPLPADLDAVEVREACRALKGAVLRQEIYALDGSEGCDRPYSVSERNYTIRQLQPRGGSRHAVFFTHAREAIEVLYERALYEVGTSKRADPRVSHAMNLDVDEYGNVLLSAAVGYARRFDDPDGSLTSDDRAKQKTTHVTFTVSGMTNAVLEPDAYRTPLVCESRTYELRHAAPAPGVDGVTALFGLGEIRDLIAHASDGQHDLPYEDISGAGATGGAPYRRRLEHTRTVYRRDDLTGMLPLGLLESRALPGESHTLALTSGLLEHVFVTAGAAKLTEMIGLLETQESGYVHSSGDANWWIPSGRVFFSPAIGDSAVTEAAFAREHFFLTLRFEDPFGHSSVVAYDHYDLLPVQTRDALQNTVAAVHDYRVLQPRQVTDPNGNRSALAFDALGLVVGTALADKAGGGGDALVGFVADLSEPTLLGHINQPTAAPHAILQGATTRLLYDLFAYQRTKNDPQPQPPVAYTLTRETHVADLAAGEQPGIQHAFSYSDGFGREIQKKVQAEPGPLVEGGLPVAPRWVGSGWTIFNNKGKPVRQYEPFFSATHRFEFAHAVGVSPVIFYDPLARVAATLYPDHTWEKVVFDPWRQEVWDRNDTALVADPKTDVDAGRYFAPLPVSDYMPTWYASHVSGTADEQDAVTKVAAHAGTPAVTHFDALGRAFLSLANNGTSGKYSTRTELDIEGNQRAVVDALGRTIMRYDYAVSGATLRAASMEAGARWSLSDVTGQPIAHWNSRGYRVRRTYDELHRPSRVWLRDVSDAEQLVEQTVYGEQQGDALNHRTRVYQVFDGAGVLTSEAYDFKGNLLRVSRRLARDYHAVLDWSAAVALEDEVFTHSTAFDALNRPVEVTTPDHSRIEPIYNEANLPERVQLTLRGSVAATAVVADIDYNAHGQRTSIVYGNGVRTEYEYDQKTCRLTHLVTHRSAEALQDLSYGYDPVGNITSVRDAAQQPVYFSNAVVSPDASYTYDAIYRLIGATGREHIGQLSTPQTDWNDGYRVNLPHPHDGQKTRRYAEHFHYDAVGNILALAHWATAGDWTRTFAYDEASQTETGAISNRLSGTAIGSTKEGNFTYDAHGNMTRLPHLPVMKWDYIDRLVASSRQGVESGTPETTYYVYDARGQRARKVTERAAASDATPVRKSERIYLSGFEVYREYDGPGAVSLERESLHVADGATRVALVETRVLGEDDSPPQLVRYQFGNHLGSAVLELDDQAQVISYEEFYPYGSTSYQAGRSLAEVKLKRYRYTGKERDEETGLNYHGARYYAPWLSRWTSADPIPRPADGNLYIYGQDNPVRFVDRNGREPTEADLDRVLESLAAARAALSERELHAFLGANEYQLYALLNARYGYRGSSSTAAGTQKELDRVLRGWQKEKLDAYARAADEKRDYWIQNAEQGATLVRRVTQGEAKAEQARQSKLRYVQVHEQAESVKDGLLAAAAGIAPGAANPQVSSRPSGVMQWGARTRQSQTQPREPAPPFETVKPGPQQRAPVPQSTGTEFHATADVRYTPAMAEEPATANFGRAAIEFGQQGGRTILRTSQRHPDDAAARAGARRTMDVLGISRVRRDAMHPVDSLLNPYFEPSTGAYYFGARSVNRSFGAQLGNQLSDTIPGVPVWVRFHGFPSYADAAPIAPVGPF